MVVPKKLPTRLYYHVLRSRRSITRNTRRFDLRGGRCLGLGDEIRLGRLLVCQKIKRCPTGHSIPMIAVRFDYATRRVRSFPPISSSILHSLGNILPREVQ